MCGIFGITYKTPQKALGTILADAAVRLSYRGYDTAGVATINNNKITLRKDAGAIEKIRKELNFDELSGNKGITQLRWATFGKPSKVNAQPHFDSKKKLVGAHNGNILNTPELNEQFIKEGMVVRSQNDGEVCVHSAEKYYDGSNMVDAIRKGMKLMKGDYAYTITDPNNDKIYCVKKGSSLSLGVGPDFTCFSSDLPSILPLTKEIMQINDGEIAELTPSSITIYSAATGKKIPRKAETFKGSIQSAQKGNYPHFFIKEINEQAERVVELVKYYEQSDEFAKLQKIYKKVDDVYIAGCGTSYHAAILGAYYLNRYYSPETVPCTAYDIDELYKRNLHTKSLIYLVSQSGETKDVVNVLNYCLSKKIPTAGLVNVIGSTISNKSDLTLPILAGYEVSVPATKTFTNEVALFMAYAYFLSKKRVDKAKLKKALSFFNDKKILAQIKTVAKLLTNFKEFYFLGYGQTIPVAMEGALKMKEVTYLHCEGMNSAEFKHGPLSAVYEGYPVLFVVNKSNSEKMQNQIHEVICRGGQPIVIAPPDKAIGLLTDKYIQTPDLEDDYLVFAANIVLQLIAYYACVEMGLDPDRPRNLSKTITVD